MKITVKGSKLIQKLQDQRTRSVAKKEEAEKFLAEHRKMHQLTPDMARPRPGVHLICVFETQVQALVAHVEGHLRRIDAAIDVIDSEREVKMSITKYINSYIEGPYDNITYPSPETPDEEGSAVMSMAVHTVQKLN